MLWYIVRDEGDTVPPLVLKARHLSGSSFCWVHIWDGFPLGLGLVEEDGPIVLSFHVC